MLKLKQDLGFEFTVINLAADTHALTLTVNTGTTLVGSVTIAAASSATFRCSLGFNLSSCNLQKVIK
jgi:hypothetical protein